VSSRPKTPPLCHDRIVAALKAKTDHIWNQDENLSKKHLVNSDNSQSLSQLSKVNSRHAKGADVAVWLMWQKG
jgi:hypothetical protein